MNIKTLIKRCKAQDRKAQRELYTLTAKDVMNVCYRYMKDMDLARDQFQETYIRVFQKLDLYDANKGSIGAWIGRIASNLCIEQLRKKNRLLFVEQVHDGAISTVDPSVEADLAAEEILAFVNQLPDHHRVVFNLHVVEGYTHREIGQMMGIQENTSRSHLYRAKSALQDLVKKSKHTIVYESVK